MTEDSEKILDKEIGETIEKILVVGKESDLAREYTKAKAEFLIAQKIGKEILNLSLAIFQFQKISGNKLDDLNRVLDETKGEFKAAAKESSENSQSIANWTKVLAVVTGIYVGAAILLTYFSYKQSSTMQESVSQGREFFEETIKSSRLDQRAWVGPIHLRKAYSETKKLVGAQAIFKNTGKTPALKFQANVWLATNDREINIPALAASMLKNSKDDSGFMSLLPNMESKSTRPLPNELSENDIGLIFSGKLHFYIFGQLNYLDIFGDSHFTKFCGKFNYRTRDFWSCKEFNEAT